MSDIKTAQLEVSNAKRKAYSNPTAPDEFLNTINFYKLIDFLENLEKRNGIKTVLAVLEELEINFHVLAACGDTSAIVRYLQFFGRIEYSNWNSKLTRELNKESYRIGCASHKYGAPSIVSFYFNTRKYLKLTWYYKYFEGYADCTNVKGFLTDSKLTLKSLANFLHIFGNKEKFETSLQKFRKHEMFDGRLIFDLYELNPDPHFLSKVLSHLQQSDSTDEITEFWDFVESSPQTLAKTILGCPPYDIVKIITSVPEHHPSNFRQKVLNFFPHDYWQQSKSPHFSLKGVGSLTTLLEGTKSNVTGHLYENADELISMDDFSFFGGVTDLCHFLINQKNGTGKFSISLFNLALDRDLQDKLISKYDVGRLLNITLLLAQIDFSQTKRVMRPPLTRLFNRRMSSSSKNLKQIRTTIAVYGVLFLLDLHNHEGLEECTPRFLTDDEFLEILQDDSLPPLAKLEFLAGVYATVNSLGNHSQISQSIVDQLKSGVEFPIKNFPTEISKKIEVLEYWKVNY